MDKHYGGYNANRSGNYSRNRADNNESFAKNRTVGSDYYNRSRSDCEDAGYVRSKPECSAEFNGNSSKNDAQFGRNRPACEAEFHLHELQGSVKTSGGDCNAHSHRFAAITCEPIQLKNGDHCHQVTFRTDTYDGHFHEFTGRTTDAFEICSGHVHYIDGRTTEQAGHCHDFRAVTHIENPTAE